MTYVYRAMRTDMKDLLPARKDWLPANKTNDYMLEQVMRALKDGFYVPPLNIVELYWAYFGW